MTNRYNLNYNLNNFNNINTVLDNSNNQNLNNNRIIFRISEDEMKILDNSIKTNVSNNYLHCTNQHEKYYNENVMKLNFDYSNIENFETLKRQNKIENPIDRSINGNKNDYERNKNRLSESELEKINRDITFTNLDKIAFENNVRNLNNSNFPKEESINVNQSN